MVVEITGAHCRVWLLLGQHSICCHSSQALQNGEPYLDKPNVPCLLHHWCHHGDPWNILLIQALQWKVSCLEILSLKSQPSPKVGWKWGKTHPQLCCVPDHLDSVEPSQDVVPICHALQQVYCINYKTFSHPEHLHHKVVVVVICT